MISVVEGGAFFVIMLTTVLLIATYTSATVSHRTLIVHGGPRIAGVSSLRSLAIKGKQFTFATSTAKLRAFPRCCGRNLSLNACDR